MNTLTPNPFMRGHIRLSNNRLLLIQYDEHYPSCLRQLHPAQQEL